MQLAADPKFTCMGTLSPFLHSSSLPKGIKSKLITKISVGQSHFVAITSKERKNCDQIS